MVGEKSIKSKIRICEIAVNLMKFKAWEVCKPQEIMDSKTEQSFTRGMVLNCDTWARETKSEYVLLLRHDAGLTKK